MAIEYVVWKRFDEHAAKLRPEAITRLLNVLYRIYADDPTAHPELELDRQILKRFVKGRLM